MPSLTAKNRSCLPLILWKVYLRPGFAGILWSHEQS